MTQRWTKRERRRPEKNSAIKASNHSTGLIKMRLKMKCENEMTIQKNKIVQTFAAMIRSITTEPASFSTSKTIQK
jgi:hypothetical protein